ncbi:MAG: CoA transferase [Actinomycetota bacterium]|nr:CoA transferase [Actinomycetota bacterium]|tara:strand:- start:202 stop:1446 length:1245 start_codon:yes stop_codon:yes gene_type:complete
MGGNDLLNGLKVVENSLLGPGLVGTFLSDLGAEVIKVESPSGDYIRQMTWPIVEGNSLLHLHTHRGKRSIAINLKDEDGAEIYRKLLKEADVVVEAMRPGTLERLGFGFDELLEINPKIVFCSISGYGATGPYRDLPSHGIAYDTWAGLIEPVVDNDGFTRIPSMPNIGINVGPMLAALGVLAAVINARETGRGRQIEVAQSDAAAYADWYRIETYRAYLRPEDEVTGNPADDYERRAPGLAGMWEGVRYQIYETTDGHILFMASERAFWENFCKGVDRMDLFERWPGSQYADHARNNTELQEDLKEIFKTRSSVDWLDFGQEKNVPIAPVNNHETVAEDPQFSHRMPFISQDELGADQLPLPIFVDGELPSSPTRAPKVGEHTDEILTELGVDQKGIDDLRSKGAVGAQVEND